MPQFGFYPAQLFWLLVSFGILFCAMQFFLLPPIANIIKKREDALHSVLQQVEDLTHKAQDLEDTYQQSIDLTTRQAAKKLQRIHNEIASETAQKEEELLSLLQQDLQKEQKYLKARTKSVLNNMEFVAGAFIQAVFSAFYDVLLPQRKLTNKIKKNLRGVKSVE